MRHCFPKSIRLRKRHQFLRMAHSCHRQVGQWTILDVRENRISNSRLGVTVTKRYGDAHERNRFKRIVREAYRLCFPQLPSKYDILIKPRSAAKQASMQDVMQDLLQLKEWLSGRLKAEG